jgi:hypothetical protein
MLFEGFQIEELSTPRGTVHALPRLYEDPLELWTPFAPRASGRQIDGRNALFCRGRAGRGGGRSRGVPRLTRVNRNGFPTGRSAAMNARDENRRRHRAARRSLPVALETILAATATPYGYTLSIWGSGAILARAHGAPTVAETFLFVAGAITGFNLLALVTEETPGRARPVQRRWDRLLAGVLNWVAVGASVGAVSLLAMIDGWVPWLVGPLVATMLYLSAVSVQLAASAPRGAGDQPPVGRG